MILGHIANFEKETGLYTPALEKGLRYLRDTDFFAMALGKHTLDGDDLFALVQEYVPEPREQRLAESHRKYIDIQFVAAGEEIIGCVPYAPTLPVHENHLAEKDLELYRALDNESQLHLTQGMYAIFYPWDVHRPCCQTRPGVTVRKVVLKVRM
jgi:biofilm protein TabA